MGAKNKCEIIFLAIGDQNDDMVPKISWNLFFCRQKSPLDVNGNHLDVKTRKNTGF